MSQLVKNYPALTQLMAWWLQDANLLPKPDLVLWYHELSLKELEMCGCVPSAVATDDLVLKHQAISIHSADQISIVLDQFQMKVSHL